MSTTKKCQKSSKITKHEKQQNWENWKSDKIDKIQKPEKSKKWKSQKCKSEKWKKSKTPKSVKCQINGTFWHFVKSEPPGPAYFEFQGVPRDPVLRPKSGVGILNGKSQIGFHHFHILWIYHFMHFNIFTIFQTNTFLIKLPVLSCYVIRPYCNIGGRCDVWCGGSPLITCLVAPVCF